MRDRPAPLIEAAGQEQLLESILPVAVAEQRGDDGPARLMPAEEALVTRAAERRRREFATGRACARTALERLGLRAEPILAGEHGEPLWPAGIVGSITHCTGFRAAAVAVAQTAGLLSIGIDAEPHRPLPERLIGRVGRPEERSRLAARSDAEPEIHWDRLLFSAKEAVYKAWFPLARRRLGLSDVRVDFDPAGRTSRGAPARRGTGGVRKADRPLRRSLAGPRRARLHGCRSACGLAGLGNAYLTVRNPATGEERRLLIGRTDGGRALTLVIERTIEPSAWLVVTGWTATAPERRMLGD